MPFFSQDLDHVVASVADAWDELRGARIFLTGGSGFFGKWLVESFLTANRGLSLNARLTVLSRRPDALVSSRPDLAGQPELDFHRGDVRNFEFPHESYSHILHLATPSWGLPQRDHEFELMDTIVQGTRRVLALAAAVGAERMLFTSSGAAYGAQPSEIERVGEDYRGAPATEDVRATYGHSKRLAEHLGAVSAANTGLAFTIARCFAFVGPGLPLDAHFAIGNFIRDGLAGDEIRVAGDGAPFRSYLYAADLAAWLWTILLRGERGRAYNVGSEEAVTIAQLARQVAAAFTPPPKVTVARAPNADAAPQRYVPDCRRARDELGLEARIPLAEAIHRTIEWLRRNSGESSLPSLAGARQSS